MCGNCRREEKKKTKFKWNAVNAWIRNLLFFTQKKIEILDHTTNVWMNCRRSIDWMPSESPFVIFAAITM